jgi:hypothetical protein
MDYGWLLCVYGRCGSDACHCLADHDEHGQVGPCVVALSLSLSLCSLLSALCSLLSALCSQLLSGVDGGIDLTTNDDDDDDDGGGGRSQTADETRITRKPPITPKQLKRGIMQAPFLLSCGS